MNHHWQKGELISAAECERIATMLQNLSISHDVDYGGDAIRQAGRQLRTRTYPPPDTGTDVGALLRHPLGGASD